MKFLLAALALALLFGCAAQIGPLQSVSGTAVQTRSYCGGAAPPPELLAELAIPKPLADKALYLKNGTVNSEGHYLAFTTDSEGRFTLLLPSGTFCIVEEYKRGAPDSEAYRRAIDEGGRCSTVDNSCFASLWQECDAVLAVGNVNVTGFTVQFGRKCPWSAECTSWSCPLPQ